MALREVSGLQIKHPRRHQAHAQVPNGVLIMRISFFADVFHAPALAGATSWSALYSVLSRSRSPTPLQPLHGAARVRCSEPSS